ncbi:hypothetical protein QN277_018615 [Acacia crassicarpa]|uniref:Plant basic secretory protein (BSP) family protein n=1 Tax=Acacia crassicarpa TaxID=499986 RepID=A0AAE1MPH6_9FABA|nr:hypothetical protein QN277_018615 [Acacia crassicarpa]
MEDQQSLLQPFLPAAATATISATSSSSRFHNSNSSIDKDLIFSSNKTVIIRLAFVFSVAAISLWANHEASKTFDITLINDAADSPAGRRFTLSYISNDRATRIILNTSSFVEHFLYPDPHQYPKKHISHVTLRLASRNLTAASIVSAGTKVNDYVIDLTPSLLEEENYKEAVVSSILRAMVRVWLWGHGKSGVPVKLIDGVVEYVAEIAGFSREEISSAGDWSPECEDDGGRWWVDKDMRHVARLLQFCETKKEGFIGRLNQAMRDTCHDHIVDNALGFPRRRLCGLSNSNASWAPQNNTLLVGGL